MDKRDKTIADVAKNNLCTGCGACAGLCPRGAIDMIKDKTRGIYLPRINKEKCNQCGICFNICPGHSVNFRQLNLAIFGKEPEDIRIGNYLSCCIGHASDYKTRYNSSSGGLVTSLLIFALEEGMIDGALVTRMSSKNPLKPQPFIARTKEEIVSAAKSKYCPVPANIALREILENAGKYAVVGLPCHIQGIRKAEMVNPILRDRIVLHMGIFCGRNISSLGTEFQLKRMGIKKEEVEKIDYRGEGWPGKLIIQLKNKQSKLSESYFDYYDNRFASFVPWRCTLCSDMLSELADISFGDAWLPELEKEKVGESVVIIRNEKAMNLLRKAISQKKIELKKMTADKIIQSQGGVEWKKKDLRARFSTAKLLGRKVPFNNNIFPGRSSFRVYLNNSLFYLERFFASKQYLWRLLNIYWLLRERIHYIKLRLTPK